MNAEREELTKQTNLNKFQKQYLQAAEKLGLILPILPKYKEYDYAWIHGAWREEFLCRLIDFNYMLTNNKIKVKKGVYLLLGSDELLYAERDGISPKILQQLVNIIVQNQNLNIVIESGELDITNIEDKIAEGKIYLQNLASKLNISLDDKQPIINYNNQDKLPKGFYPRRSYPNYLNLKDKTLTQADMGLDILNRYFTIKLPIKFVHTITVNNRRTKY